MPTLLALHAHALSLQQHNDSVVPLGEQFFRLPLDRAYSDKVLRLHSPNKELEALYSLLRYEAARKHRTQPSLAKARNTHWRLIGCLLNKDLERFARLLLAHYTMPQDKKRLPKYYRQALYLYGRKSMDPIYDYDDVNTEAHFADFVAYRQKIRHQLHNNMGKKTSVEQQRDLRTAERNEMQKVYGETYWFYYDYCQ